MASGGVNASIAVNGTLVYVSGGPLGSARALAWVDRQGREELLAAPPRVYIYPRISPDGTRVALDIRDEESDVWIWDLMRETLTRLTVDPALDGVPLWTPDSRSIVFASHRSGKLVPAGRRRHWGC
jgi:serine/threonine-protein kinase